MKKIEQLITVNNLMDVKKSWGSVFRKNRFRGEKYIKNRPIV